MCLYTTNRIIVRSELGYYTFTGTWHNHKIYETFQRLCWTSGVSERSWVMPYMWLKIVPAAVYDLVHRGSSSIGPFTFIKEKQTLHITKWRGFTTIFPRGTYYNYFQLIFYHLPVCVVAVPVLKRTTYKPKK